jgi:hypothetical protein
MLSTPAAEQASYSDCSMAREAPVMSGWSGPTPPQNTCMPPRGAGRLDHRRRHSGHAG